jgi:hypothetical protein
MISQDEADELLATPKEMVDRGIILIPVGRRQSRDLVSLDGRHEFLLDINRATINIAKITYQTRARKAVVLARLDLDGAPHTNLDGEMVDCPHLHVYREGFDDKWARRLDPRLFSDPVDMVTVLSDFARLCAIQSLPPVQVGAW